MIFVGIDPGVTGGIAAIEGDEAYLYDTPTRKIEGKTKTTTLVDGYKAARMLQSISSGRAITVAIEKVNAMPGKDGKGGRQTIGATSAFNFGMGFGMWLGIMDALCIPYELVTPQAWKKALQLVGQEKDSARIRAMQLYPLSAKDLQRKRDIGRADALCIAEWLRTNGTIGII